MTTNQIKKIVQLTERIVDKKLNTSKKLNEATNATRMIQPAVAAIIQHGSRVLKEVNVGNVDSASLSYLISALETNLPKLKLIYNSLSKG